MVIETLARLAASRYWWLLVAVVAAAAEALALFYQYRLGIEPCVLCVQVRMWMAGLVLLGGFGVVWAPRGWWGALLMQAGALVLMIGLLERVWQTWATENGIAQGSCGMSVNLPAWFALDRWLPSLFEPREMCGYTPELIAGISMADALLYGAAAAVIVTAVLLLAVLVRFRGADS